MPATRKLLLPQMVVTVLADASDADSTRIEFPDGGMYYLRPIQDAETRKRLDSQGLWVGSRFNLFPVVMDTNGVPWAEANIYLLSRIEDAVEPRMSTYSGIADGLGAYRHFLDEKRIDWTWFPAHKLSRPTYRFSGFLKLAVRAGEVSASTASRWMGAVIAFYKWMREEGLLVLEHQPWKESDRYIQLSDTKGATFTKKVTSTDVGIKVPKSQDPYVDTIDDGGKLRPLTKEEQDWLLEALAAIGNTEMTLIHVFAMVTGARIQTILTFKVRHTLVELDDPDQQELRFAVGPGTGVDTKGDKPGVLHIPMWLYEALAVYAQSDRARRRRERAPGGDTDDQYLFLSERGAALYQSKADAAKFDSNAKLRHAKSGQAVRQFIAERVLPFIREHHAMHFKYQFHDTRATHGMNLTDDRLALVASGEITLHQAREFVKTRMGHSSAAVTDRYLNYRSNLHLTRQVNSDYDSHLRDVTKAAMKGFE
jgi:integrase